jgi:resuscitation-promoting factor RpfB
VNTYRLTWKNRKLVRQRLVTSTLRARPVTQVVEVGTKARPRYAPSADGLNWSALARCESGGNPRAVSSGGTYRGLYQFTMGTWHSVGGSGDPIDASSNEQTYRAQVLYRRSGDSAWPTCGHYLYS